MGLITDPDDLYLNQLSDDQLQYLKKIKKWLLEQLDGYDIWNYEKFHHPSLPVPINIHLLELVISRLHYPTNSRDYLNSLKPLYRLMSMHDG